MSAQPAVIVSAEPVVLPELDGLSLREAWDLEERIEDARAAITEFIDGEIRRRVDEGKSSRAIAAEVGRSQTTVMRRIARLELALSDSRGGHNKVLNPPVQTPPTASDPEGEEVWGEVVELPTQSEERKSDRMAVHYSSETDEWATPQDFFDVVNAEFTFDLDVCALESSNKCPNYYSPECDGLAQDWTGTCWMNPPYGNEIGDWVQKAYESSQTGATVVCLVPARTDTAWWHDYCGKGEIRLIRGRLKFGTADASAPFPSALVVFGPGKSRIRNWEWR